MNFVKILMKSASSTDGFDTPVSLVDLLFGAQNPTWRVVRTMRVLLEIAWATDRSS
jgi:hypothetical protein